MFMMKLIDQSFLLEVQNVNCILWDDTDVFVLLAYWVNWANLQCKVQMEHLDVSVIDINVISADIGQKCLQLLCIYACAQWL